MTTEPVYGKNLTLKLGGTQITNLRANGIDLGRDMRDITSKDSADWREVRVRFKNGSISFSGLMAEAAAKGFEEIYDIWDAGSIAVWELSSSTPGDTKYSGSGLVTSLKFDAPYDDNVEFSGQIDITGTITKGTVS